MWAVVWILAGLALGQECAEAEVATCDDRRIFDSVGAFQNAFDRYDCPAGAFDADGAEYVWELDLSDAEGAVTIDHFVDDPYGDGTLVVLEGACAPENCLVAMREVDVATVEPKPGERYWLVVEDRFNATSTIDISCLPAPGSGDEEPADTDEGGCGGSAWLVLMPLMPLMLLRPRQRA